MAGTHQGKMEGILATGRAVTQPSITILRLANGKIAEGWFAAHNLSMMQQLVSGIVHLVAVLGGVIPDGLGWFGVGFSLVFVLAFGYFGFIRPDASVTPGLQS